MTKPKKLKLNGLTVQSFVTSLKKEEGAEVKGGATEKSWCPCMTDVSDCISNCYTLCGDTACPGYCTDAMTVCTGICCEGGGGDFNPDVRY